MEDSRRNRRKALERHRKGKRSLLFRERRDGLEHEEDKWECVSASKIYEIAEKVKNNEADVECLWNLRLASCSEQNIRIFMSVPDVLPAFGEIFAGDDPAQQVEALSCIINLSCGSHETTEKVARNMGVYLVNFMMSTDGLLQGYAAWAAGNLANDCQQCFSIVRSQGVLPSLVDLLESSNPGVIQSSIFALRACSKYTETFSDLEGLPLGARLLFLLSSTNIPTTDVVVQVAYVLSKLCQYISIRDEAPELQIAIATATIIHVSQLIIEENFLVPLAATLLQCLGILTNGSSSVCDTLCSTSCFHFCVMWILNSHLHQLKDHVFWILTNITGHAQTVNLPFDLNHVLDIIRVFLSPTEKNVSMALYMLCCFVQKKPEVKEVIKRKGLVEHVENLAVNGSAHIRCAVDFFLLLMNS